MSIFEDLIESKDPQLEHEMIKYSGLSHETLMKLMSIQVKSLRSNKFPRNTNIQIKSVLAMVLMTIKEHDSALVFNDIETAEYVSDLLGTQQHFGEQNKVVDIWEE